MTEQILGNITMWFPIIFLFMVLWGFLLWSTLKMIVISIDNLRDNIATYYRSLTIKVGFPHIICICGSGRFMEQMRIVEFDQTLKFKIILMIGCNTKDVARNDDWKHVKPMLDKLHLRKIDLCDEVYVVDVQGYIGDSTKAEIAYAVNIGKPIRYWSKEYES